MRRPAALTLALVLAAAALGAAAPAHADDWEKIFQQLSPNATIVEGQQVTHQVYRGQIVYTITNHDGISGNFSGADTVNINIKGTNLAFNGTKAGLISYADAHAGQIWQAIFGVSPVAAVTGTSESQVSSAAVVSNLTPPAVPSLLERHWTNDVMASGEYNYLKVGDTSVQGSSGIFTYGHTVFGPKNELGFAMPYRMLSANDDLHTKINAFQPSIYLRHTALSGQPVFFTYGVTGFLGVNNFSDTMIDNSLYYRYGGNAFTSVGREIYPWLAIFGDLSYEIGKYWVPKGGIDSDLQFIADAINDLPTDQTITFGARAGFVFIPDRLWGTLQVFRINSVGGQTVPGSEFETVTMFKLGTQIFNFIYVDAGYKTSFEIKDYTDNTFILNVRAVF